MPNSTQWEAVWRWWTAVRTARLTRDFRPLRPLDTTPIETTITELLAASDEQSPLNTSVITELNRVASRWIYSYIDWEIQGYGNLLRKRVQALLEQLDTVSESSDE